MQEAVIPILRISQAATAVAWYNRLGFEQEWEHRFEPGDPDGNRLRIGPARG